MNSQDDTTMDPLHFLSLSGYSKDWYDDLFRLAGELKTKQQNRKPHPLLQGKVLTMIFQKPSARTRLSFDVAMYQLGGYAVNLSRDEIQLGVRESTPDIARLVSRMSDGILARLFSHGDLEELAAFSRVPVINGLTDLLHPCQILADAFTIMEHRGSVEGQTIAYIGDGNNIVNSWLSFSTKFAIHLKLAIPSSRYDPDAGCLADARDAGLSTIDIYRDPAEAASNADVVYTDVWTSMGQENERVERIEAFQGYQINTALMGHAKSDAIVLHCLPAHRGEEITDAVIESPQSTVFDQAENRLHTEKALLVKLLG